MLKALQDISYKEIAEYLEISKSAMYNWLRNQYDLSEKREIRLKEILSNLEEYPHNTKERAFSQEKSCQKSCQIPL